MSLGKEFGKRFKPDLIKIAKQGLENLDPSKFDVKELEDGTVEVSDKLTSLKAHLKQSSHGFRKVDFETNNNGKVDSQFSNISPDMAQSKLESYFDID